MTRLLAVLLIRLGGALVLRGMRAAGVFDAGDFALMRAALLSAIRVAHYGRPARQQASDEPRYTAPGPMGPQ